MQGSVLKIMYFVARTCCSVSETQLMDSRVNKLIAEFEQTGWKCEGSVELKSDWWFEDILLFVSKWRPAGTALYLTLLTDPQIIKKKVVWAISISCSLPEQNDLKSIQQLSLNDIKKTNLSEFVKEINSIALNKFE